MWPYLITYDLAEPDRHSAAIGAVLQDMGAVALADHAWLLTSDWNASAILEQLRPIIGSQDRLLVFELGEDLAASNLHPLSALSDGMSLFSSPGNQNIN